MEKLEKSKLSDKTKLIMKQIEYYMSDKNLQHDSFFYEIISKDSIGGIEISHFLNCNNIKKLEASEEDIREAIKHSEKLFLSADTNFALRKGEQPLPIFLGKKRNLEAEEEKLKKKEENLGPKDKLNFYIQHNDPIILQITSDKDQSVRWKEIQKYVQDFYPDFECVYMRFSFQKGNAALFPKVNPEGSYSTNQASNTELSLKETNLSKNDSKDKSITKNKSSTDKTEKDHLTPDASLITKKTFTKDGINFTINLANEVELTDFWKNHGSHYEYCISSIIDLPKVKKGLKKKNENSNLLKTPVTLGGEM